MNYFSIISLNILFYIIFNFYFFNYYLLLLFFLVFIYFIPQYLNHLGCFQILIDDVCFVITDVAWNLETSTTPLFVCEMRNEFNQNLVKQIVFHYKIINNKIQAQAESLELKYSGSNSVIYQEEYMALSQHAWQVWWLQ